MFLPVPVPTVSSPTTPGMQPYAKAQTRGTRVAGRCACRADHPLFSGKHTTKTTLSAVHRACLRTTARTGGGAGGERGYTDTRTAGVHLTPCMGRRVTHVCSYARSLVQLRRELGSNRLRGPGWSRAAAVVSETSIGQCGKCSNASMMRMLVHAYTSDV